MDSYLKSKEAQAILKIIKELDAEARKLPEWLRIEIRVHVVPKTRMTKATNQLPEAKGAPQRYLQHKAASI